MHSKKGSDNHAELKTLTRQLEESKENVKKYTEERKILNEKLSKEQANLQKIQDDIKKLKSETNIVVSEHAILRYCERVLKLDLEEIKKKIIPEDVLELVRKLGNGNYPTESHHVRVTNGVVVTITTD